MRVMRLSAQVTIISAIVSLIPTLGRESRAGRSSDRFGPQITGDPVTLTIHEADTTSLPCNAVRQGAFPLVWRKGHRVITAGSTLVAGEDRRFSVGNSGALLIGQVRPTDAGRYTCAINTDPVVQITHTLHVLYKPRLLISPGSGVLIAIQGQNATLKCIADGNPTPSVLWSRVTETGTTSADTSGAELVFSAVTRGMEGRYRCQASNSVGFVHSTVSVLVQYGPEITMEKSIVYTAPGLSITLKCFVSANPPAEVIWSRRNGIMEPGHHVFDPDTSLNTRHVMYVAHVQRGDLDTYTCSATNRHDTDSRSVLVTGVPFPPRFLSDVHGSDATSYSLSWNVRSYSEITQYKLLYSSQTPSSEGSWREVTVPMGSPSPDADAAEEGVTASRLFNQCITLPDLRGDSTYRVRLQSKNRYGWSAVSAEFQFTTAADNPNSESEDRKLRVTKLISNSSQKTEHEYQLTLTTLLLSIHSIHLVMSLNCI